MTIFNGRARSRQSEDHAFVTGQNTSGQLDETEVAALVEGLGKIIEGKYQVEEICRQADLDDSLKKALEQFAAYQAQKDSRNLEKNTRLSLGLLEEVISSATPLAHFHQVRDNCLGIATVAEQTVASVSDISDKAASVAELTRTGRTQVENGANASQKAAGAMSVIGNRVISTNQQVGELADASQKIGGIVSQIEAIASQTNLLALNASIEAARAGEAGKGFVVVAQEVKALAAQTAKATAEITGQIEWLQSELAKINEAMAACAESVKDGDGVLSSLQTDMAQALEGSIQVEHNMADISAIVEEQRISAVETANNVRKVATETNDSIKQMNGLIDSIDRTFVTSKNHVEDFLDGELPEKLLQVAKIDHMVWRKNLSEMIIGRKGLDAKELSDHTQCRLGKWYQNIASPELRQSAHYKALHEPHKLVHQHGIRAVEMHAKGDLKAALSEIEQVAKASETVVGLLEKLIQEQRKA